MKIYASLIISTYNNPQFLSLCLESVLRQSMNPLEIIVADDGSTTETRDCVTKYSNLSPVPIIHVWHEDRGFRLAEIRNKAIAIAKGNYIIQIDGDLILERHFVEDHVKAASNSHFVLGGRAKFTEEATSKLVDSVKVIPSFFSKGLKVRENAIRFLPLGLLFRNIRRSPMGCNMSFWKDDMLRINGYDNDFVGWGYEDIDVLMRLQAIGITQTRLKFCGICYHLYHKKASRANVINNSNRLAEKKNQQEIITKNGIAQLKVFTGN